MNEIILLDKIKSFYQTDNRLSWTDYFMMIASLTALRSPSIKKKVGSIIVKNNRIIATGYNGFPSGTDHKSILKNGKEINTIHAEQNAVSQCAKLGISCDKAEIYITHFPCINCSKIIVASGINKIYYLNDNHNEDSKPFLENSNIYIEKITL